MKEYWADAGTSNCVWLFQIRANGARERYWKTYRVFLNQYEARVYGILKYGERDDNKEIGEDWEWRAFGVPCDGKMAEILGRHTGEFKPKDNHRKDCQCPDCGRTIRWEEE